MSWNRSSKYFTWLHNKPPTIKAASAQSNSSASIIYLSVWIGSNKNSHLKLSLLKWKHRSCLRRRLFTGLIPKLLVSMNHSLIQIGELSTRTEFPFKECSSESTLHDTDRLLKAGRFFHLNNRCRQWCRRSKIKQNLMQNISFQAQCAAWNEPQKLQLQYWVDNNSK